MAGPVEFFIPPPCGCALVTLPNDTAAQSNVYVTIQFCKDHARGPQALAPDGSAKPYKDIFTCEASPDLDVAPVRRHTSKEGEVCPHGLYQDGFLIKCAYCAGSWRPDGTSMGGFTVSGGLPWCLNSGDSIWVLPK